MAEKVEWTKDGNGYTATISGRVWHIAAGDGRGTWDVWRHGDEMGWWCKSLEGAKKIAADVQFEADCMAVENDFE